MAGLPVTPEMALISESVENANARIRFFRIAYGGAAADQKIGHAEVTGTLAALARGGRMTYLWEPEGERLRREVRAAFLVMQCCESAMPIGGTIRVRRDVRGWEIEAVADRLAMDDGLWAGLLNPGGASGVDAAHVQFALLPAALAEAGRTLSFTTGKGRIEARF
jgi:histidine phosphotransferase ChpT